MFYILPTKICNYCPPLFEGYTKSKISQPISRTLGLSIQIRNYSITIAFLTISTELCKLYSKLLPSSEVTVILVDAKKSILADPVVLIWLPVN